MEDVADERTSRSPERVLWAKGLFGRAFAYFLRPFYLPVRSKVLQIRWRKNADSRRLDFRWNETHFNRIALVNLLLSKFEAPKYLEIGCAGNALFDSVPAIDKVGVDPLMGGNVRLTSDDFFANNTSKFDVVFIDGLHTYEQVRRDVQNSIMNSNPGSWIALHDMLPRTWIEHHVPLLSPGAWTGDVWKVAFEISKTPGLDFRILKIDHGVGVVRVVDPSAKLTDLRDELITAEFSYYIENLEKLPVFTWEESQEWLRS